MSKHRDLSYSEITTALDCWAKWDFRYGDQLAGSSLKEKTVVPLLSGGRAWGAAVAAWHTHVDEDGAGAYAVTAMDASLDEDAEQMKEFGVYDEESHLELRLELLGMLTHYTDTAEATLMDPMPNGEQELLVPLPSRTGGTSNRYRMLCYLDATETDEDGDVWLNEFKLRGRLMDVELIVNSRQIRWYAWAYEQQFGVKVAGVWVNERLREVPKQARILQSGKPSHAKDQLCTPESYQAVCLEAGENPHQDVVDSLGQRRWQQRVPVIFRDGELEEAGRELVDAAKFIRLLDAGELQPIRHVTPQNCRRCQFRDICPSPDSDLVEVLFERTPPKRDRDETEPGQNPRRVSGALS